MNKYKRAYILYANEHYFEIVSACVKSIRTFSEYPIIVYLINSDLKVEGENVKTVRWDFDIDVNDDVEMYNKQSDSNFYVNRSNTKVYKLLIQRPRITQDALLNYAETVTYVDSDSIATPNVDKIFDYYDTNLNYPYFVKGIYDWMTLGDRGGADSRDDLSTTLEHPICDLLGIDQYVRDKYRQSGFYVSGQNTISFLEEWYNMCIHPEVMRDHNLYAPYHEETVVNALLWKHKIQDGLPYIYTNGSSDFVDKVYTGEIEFTGSPRHLKHWSKIPATKEELFFFHGEKRIDVMEEMIEKIKKYNNMCKIKVLFLAPHLSTGGMPGFLLKRIEELLKYKEKVDLFVVEYTNLSGHFVVQKNKIKEIVEPNKFWTLGDNKLELIDIIKDNKIDIVHIDEMIECLGDSKEFRSQLYSKDRTWRVVETCHNVSFNPNDSKVFDADAYAFCTPYHKEVSFSKMASYSDVIEFPIENYKVSEEVKKESRELLGLDLTKTHIMNVGLWTRGKNQGEGVEIARLLEKTNPELQFHFIGNQAGNFQDYWEPIISKGIPSNVKIWGERNDVHLFMKSADIFMFNSTWECNPLVLKEAISYGLKILSRNLPQYMNMFTPYIKPIEGDIESISKSMLELISADVSYTIPEGQNETFANKHIDMYSKIITKKPMNQVSKSSIKINQLFVNNPFLEIKGESESTFTVKFFDEKGVCHYDNNNLKINSWVRLNREYYTKWNAKVWENGNLIYDNVLDLKDQRVYISFDSKSLGDSIAWVPYVREFQNKHKCKLIVSTFWNKLFKETYPDIEFVEPGISVNNIIAMYKIGWFYSEAKEPVLPNTIPLQMAATNILGLEFKEIKSDVYLKPKENTFSKKKYVTIANESTAGCKYWNNPTGWQEVVNYLVSKGYDVINVSKNGDKLDNVLYLEDTSIENTMNCIHHSEYFIGLSSGLSWLAWGIGKHVVMISNFTEADHEFTINCTRITNMSVCNGCWNNPNFKFDKGDWYWCPINKGTKKHFECHKSITSEMVINKIKNL